MSLRLRLMLAFFALSVVPLGAVTFIAYRANVEALQEAAEREADLLAGELSQRMSLVTAQLAERVEHLMDIAELCRSIKSMPPCAIPRGAGCFPMRPTFESSVWGWLL
jgi:hypothetical protein